MLDMLCTRRWLSSGLSSSTPFAISAIQLGKIYLQHKNALADDDPEGEGREARGLEDDFKRELNKFRPLFSPINVMETDKEHRLRLFNALRHFKLLDDPLSQQLAQILGRKIMRMKVTTSHFRGVVPTGIDFVGGTRKGSVFHFTPEEMPLPPEHVFSPTVLPKNALPLREEHRGHWILRDPDIAISRRERREDPW